MDSEMILPCPSCGRLPTENHQHYWTGMRSIITMYKYCCNQDFDHFVQVKGKTDEEAVAAWNKLCS